MDFLLVGEFAFGCWPSLRWAWFRPLTGTPRCSCLQSRSCSIESDTGGKVCCLLELNGGKEREKKVSWVQNENITSNSQINNLIPSATPLFESSNIIQSCHSITF